MSNQNAALNFELRLIEVINIGYSGLLHKLNHADGMLSVVEPT